MLIKYAQVYASGVQVVCKYKKTCILLSKKFGNIKKVFLGGNQKYDETIFGMGVEWLSVV